MNYIYIDNQNNNYKVLKFCILSLTSNAIVFKPAEKSKTKSNYYYCAKT